MAEPMSMSAFGSKLLYSQWFVRIPRQNHDFSGQTVIVTGSNTGLGLEAVRQLVRHGAAKVIMAVRTISKGEAAARQVLADTKATKDVVEVWPLDLSNYDSIKAFGARVEKLERLDAVIQNAGVLLQHWETANEDEAHVGVNVMGALLVGLLVLPKLRESARKFGTRTRLSFVGSDTMLIAKFKEANTKGSLFDALHNEGDIDINDRSVFHDIKRVQLTTSL
jgi:NAD(P)-dependent dehydrogenase (short-subunit alcohol dehydrogenase family)